jgi:hypothetical protein
VAQDVGSEFKPQYSKKQNNNNNKKVNCYMIVHLFLSVSCDTLRKSWDALQRKDYSRIVWGIIFAWECLV